MRRYALHVVVTAAAAAAAAAALSMGSRRFRLILLVLASSMLFLGAHVPGVASVRRLVSMPPAHPWRRGLGLVPCHRNPWTANYLEMSFSSCSKVVVLIALPFQTASQQHRPGLLLVSWSTVARRK
jgi:hypothetical protein